MLWMAFVIGNYSGKVDILSTSIALVIYRFGTDFYARILGPQIIYVSELFDKTVYRPFNSRASVLKVLIIL